MIANQGSLTFYVMGWNGQTVPKISGTLDVFPQFLTRQPLTPTGNGNLTVTATGSDGTLTFNNIPKVEDLVWLEGFGYAAQYVLYIAPVKDDSGALAYSGYTRTYMPSELTTAPYTRSIVLPPGGVSQALKVDASNVDNLISPPSAGRLNLVPSAGPINIVFNQRIANAFVQIWNDEPDITKLSLLSLTTPFVINSVGNQLQISPKAPSTFQPGYKYNLVVQVTSQDDPNKFLKVGVPFFGGDPSAPRPSTVKSIGYKDLDGNGLFDKADTLIIEFDRYLGTSDRTAFKVPIYFDADLDGSGKLGDSPGEKDSHVPLCADMAEDLSPISPAQASAYANKAQLAAAALGGGNVPENRMVYVVWDDALKCGSPIETIWGDPPTPGTVNLPLVHIPNP